MREKLSEDQREHMTLTAETIRPTKGARRHGRSPELPGIGSGAHGPEPERPSFEQAFKNIDDVLWKEAGCTTELDYTEQTSWLLFLKYLDGLEQDKAMEAELEGKKYSLSSTNLIAGRAGLLPRVRTASSTTTPR